MTGVLQSKAMTRYQSGDTIVARATPPGRGGVAVTRVSGPDARRIAIAVLGRAPEPRRALFRRFLDADGQALDSGIALYFPGPASYTGEDVLELQGHGSPLAVELLIDRIIGLGARAARPGEFSERAFLNDKLDLLQAEAIADLIDSDSKAAARAAHRSLEGAFSQAVLLLNEQVTELRMYVEAAIDFPEEEIDFLADEALHERLNGVDTEFQRLAATVKQGRLLRDGIHIVIAGRPNAGKSSLLNALAGYDAAIVTDVPGTTRDVIREQLELDGLPVHIVDTAGLRDSTDVVEQEGVRRTRAQLEKADLALLVVDSTRREDELDGLRAEMPADIPAIEVRNKADLSGESPGAQKGADTITVSALTGAGLPALRAAILARAGFQSGAEGTITARQRHVDVLTRARAHFDAGRQQLTDARAGELLAEELREVQNVLAEITGEFTSDDLLGKIFGSFCIGK